MITASTVKYSVGKCIICAEKAELGDGICEKCWDACPDEESMGKIQTALQYSDAAMNQKEKLHFSRKEMEIIYYISRGYSNRAIADKLFNSPKTIIKHLERIYRKIPAPRWAYKRVWLAINYKVFWERKRGGK